MTETCNYYDCDREAVGEYWQDGRGFCSEHYAQKVRIEVDGGRGG